MTHPKVTVLPAKAGMQVDLGKDCPPLPVSRVAEAQSEHLLVAHCGAFLTQAREFKRGQAGGQQRIDASTQLRNDPCHGTAAARMDGVVEADDARRGRQPSLHRRDQGERHEQPVFVAFLQEEPVGNACSGNRLVGTAKLDQRNHRIQVKMPRAGACIESVELSDGGTGMLQSSFWPAELYLRSGDVGHRMLRGGQVSPFATEGNLRLRAGKCFLCSTDPQVRPEASLLQSGPLPRWPCGSLEASGLGYGLFHLLGRGKAYAL
jgi:hypothetical protein